MKLFLFLIFSMSPWIRLRSVGCSCPSNTKCLMLQSIISLWCIFIEDSDARLRIEIIQFLLHRTRSSDLTAVHLWIRGISSLILISRTQQTIGHYMKWHLLTSVFSLSLCILQHIIRLSEDKPKQMTVMVGFREICVSLSS